MTSCAHTNKTNAAWHFRDGNSTSPCPTAQVYLWFGQQVQPSLNLTSKVLISAAVFSVDAKMLEMVSVVAISHVFCTEAIFWLRN